MQADNAVEAITFKTKGIGSRPTVTVDAKGISYETRSPNILTWLLVIGTLGAALLAWPWIKFGKKVNRLPLRSISEVSTRKGAGWTSVVVETGTGQVEFRTDADTAARVVRALS